MTWNCSPIRKNALRVIKSEKIRLVHLKTLTFTFIFYCLRLFNNFCFCFNPNKLKFLLDNFKYLIFANKIYYDPKTRWGQDSGRWIIVNKFIGVERKILLILLPNLFSCSLSSFLSADPAVWWWSFRSNWESNWWRNRECRESPNMPDNFRRNSQVGIYVEKKD